MQIVNNSNLTFHSTLVPIDSKKPIMDYFSALKTCNLKSIQNKNIQECYETLFNKIHNGICETGVMLDKDASMKGVLRFLGFSKENDEYIFRQLKKINPQTKYIKDIPNDGYEHGTIELII